jgi:hypothetical protein
MRSFLIEVREVCEAGAFLLSLSLSLSLSL